MKNKKPLLMITPFLILCPILILYLLISMTTISSELAARAVLLPFFIIALLVCCVSLIIDRVLVYKFAPNLAMIRYVEGAVILILVLYQIGAQYFAE